MAKITAHIDGSGCYDAPPEFLDRAIAQYLPNSAAKLQEIVEEQAGHAFGNLSVSQSLVVLASFYADNPF